ncbi:MAG TPA: hydrolase [Pseudogracilibacillus sp.]|nr:hydrolase [Pseudogracilibacillus sp.]
MAKKTYYIDLQSREISQNKTYNNHHYQIEATHEEAMELRRLLTKVYDADVDAYWRAHIPFVPYHKDLANDQYDEAFTAALALVYDLGDEATRAYIDTTGVLSDRSLDSRRT